MSTSLLHSIPRAAAAPFSASPKIRVSLRHKHHSATAAGTSVGTSVSSGTSLTLRAALDGGGGAPRRLVDLIRTAGPLTELLPQSVTARAVRQDLAAGQILRGADDLALIRALGVNDVMAAVLCVLVTEYATKFYYSRDKVMFPLALLNNFKMRFTYGLFIDAFKLAS